MLRFSHLYMLIAIALTSTARAEDATEDTKPIPLDQIWGYNLPGTRDVRELEPKRDTRNMSREEYVWGSYVNRISSRLGKGPKKGQSAGPAFVVVGTGREALKNADAVFLGRKLFGQLFPRDTDLTLVFFSHPTSWEMRIISVEKSTGQILVKYQCVTTQPSESRFRTLESAFQRFALIPLGKLPPGKVQVTIEQLPSVDREGKPAKYVREPDSFVCNSSSFTVE